jgi:hypothetical protein
VLVQEAIAVGSRLGWVLDVAAGTDGGGRWWHSPVSKDGGRRARTG